VSLSVVRVGAMDKDEQRALQQTWLGLVNKKHLSDVTFVVGDASSENGTEKMYALREVSHAR